MGVRGKIRREREGGREGERERERERSKGYKGLQQYFFKTV